MQEQGLLIRLPCKVGSEIYIIDKGEIIKGREQSTPSCAEPSGRCTDHSRQCRWQYLFPYAAVLSAYLCSVQKGNDRAAKRRGQNQAGTEQKK